MGVTHPSPLPPPPLNPPPPFCHPQTVKHIILIVKYLFFLTIDFPFSISEVLIELWRASFRDSGPLDQYIKSRQDMDKKGKMGVHHYRRSCHTIRPYLQTLKDNIIKAEKDKAMKEFRSTESLNLSGTADTPEANKQAVIEHHIRCVQKWVKR